MITKDPEKNDMTDVSMTFEYILLTQLTGLASKGNVQDHDQ